MFLNFAKLYENIYSLYNVVPDYQKKGIYYFLYFLYNVVQYYLYFLCFFLKYVFLMRDRKLIYVCFLMTITAFLYNFITFNCVFGVKSKIQTSLLRFIHVSISDEFTCLQSFF